MIDVCIIEDLTDYRDGLRMLLNMTDDIQCVAAYASCEEAMNEIVALTPQVALVDIQLPGASGIELVKFIRSNSPATLCMMCTAYDEDEKVFEALHAGAHGYILKSTSPGKIIDAIKELVDGGSPMSTDVARKVVLSFMKKTQAQPQYIISDRETDVLQLLAKGLLYKEIATQLNISAETVRRHCFNIYQKLHVNNRTEALNKYFNH